VTKKQYWFIYVILITAILLSFSCTEENDFGCIEHNERIEAKIKELEAYCVGKCKNPYQKEIRALEELKCND
jgi:hypothetical protein